MTIVLCKLWCIWHSNKAMKAMTQVKLVCGGFCDEKFKRWVFALWCDMFQFAWVAFEQFSFVLLFFHRHNRYNNLISFCAYDGYGGVLCGKLFSESISFLELKAFLGSFVINCTRIILFFFCPWIFEYVCVVNLHTVNLFLPKGSWYWGCQVCKFGSSFV